MWLWNEETEPYNSYGNGSAMRVSPVGFYARTLDEALSLAKISAEVTHNHPEGINGAQATAAAIFMARQGASKTEIRDYIEQTFQYDLHRTVDEVAETAAGKRRQRDHHVEPSGRGGQCPATRNSRRGVRLHRQ